ncbi:Abi family protein [Microbacterium sp. NPDC076911]|uniref:Abi family protein n=1 Tax=Microbacterium sp. NPDC076911 TaxID=3154958 RepID=UPI00344A6322
MVDYTKPWLSIDQQIAQLRDRGLLIGDVTSASNLLQEVGYYRLTGYLYPARQSEQYVDAQGRTRTKILNTYRADTYIEHAAALIAFDRELRLLVLDAVERIEVSLRTQVGYILGAESAFAHLNERNFVPSFVAPYLNPKTDIETSKHAEWISRVDERRTSSKEAFVEHFRTKYDNQMPIWALTEILELGNLATLYGGLQNDLATRIARHYEVPTKTILASWISSINYVRNVAAHQARLFNRKLVVAPTRPKEGAIQLLNHLRHESAPKQDFGLYNALSIMAYLLRGISGYSEWVAQLRALIPTFPVSPHLNIDSMGFPAGWEGEPLWNLPGDTTH